MLISVEGFIVENGSLMNGPSNETPACQTSTPAYTLREFKQDGGIDLLYFRRRIHEERCRRIEVNRIRS